MSEFRRGLLVEKQKSRKLLVAGFNYNGQLGTGDIVNVNDGFKQFNNRSWESVECFDNSTFGIDIKGNLYSWGQDYKGSLGLGNLNSPNGYTNITTPTKVGAKKWKKVVGIEGAIFALDADGKLYTWGYSGSNYFGIAYPQYTPVKVDDRTWDDIFCSYYAFIARADNGDMYYWGYLPFAQGYDTSIFTTPTLITLYGSTTQVKNIKMVIPIQSDIFCFLTDDGNAYLYQNSQKLYNFTGVKKLIHVVYTDVTNWQFVVLLNDNSIVMREGINNSTTILKEGVEDASPYDKGYNYPNFQLPYYTDLSTGYLMHDNEVIIPHKIHQLPLTSQYKFCILK